MSIINAETAAKNIRQILEYRGDAVDPFITEYLGGFIFLISVYLLNYFKETCYMVSWYGRFSCYSSTPT